MYILRVLEGLGLKQLTYKCLSWQIVSGQWYVVCNEKGQENGPQEWGGTCVIQTAIQMKSLSALQEGLVGIELQLLI